MHLDGHKPNETGLPAGDRPSLHSGILSWIIHGRSEIFFHIFSPPSQDIQEPRNRMPVFLYVHIRHQHDTD